MPVRKSRPAEELRAKRSLWYKRKRLGYMRGCTGKVYHCDLRHALVVVDRMYGYGCSDIQAYKCRHCKGFHLSSMIRRMRCPTQLSMTPHKFRLTAGVASCENCGWRASFFRKVTLIEKWWLLNLLDSSELTNYQRMFCLHASELKNQAVVSAAECGLLDHLVRRARSNLLEKIMRYCKYRICR